jgi:single-strand DNA-binding protein
MNKAILSGRISSDIELKNTPSGTSVCSFRLAVQRRFKNADGNYDADFIPCVAWRSNADFIGKYFKKGEPIELVGSIQTRTYDKDGQKVYVTEVVVDESGFVLSNKKDDNRTTQADVFNAIPNNTFNSFPNNDGFVPAPADSELPF